MAYETGPFGIALSNTPSPAGGMSSLMDMFNQSQKNNVSGLGFVGDAANVGIGIATGNPIQVAMGLYGGVNDILAGWKQRKAEKLAKLQALQSSMGRSGSGW